MCVGGSPPRHGSGDQAVAPPQIINHSVHCSDNSTVYSWRQRERGSEGRREGDKVRFAVIGATAAAAELLIYRVTHGHPLAYAGYPHIGSM